MKACSIKNYIRFGRRVAECRMSRNLTQEALADRANMTPIAIGYIEQGRRWPRLETLLKIAKGLEIDVSELLKGVDD